jgi:hypothetical protein
MKIILLFVRLFLVIDSLFAQSAMLQYNEIKVITDDTITINNSIVVMFSRQTLITLIDDRRVNSLLVPGSEFDNADAITSDDTTSLFECDSLSNTTISQSIDHPMNTCCDT